MQELTCADCGASWTRELTRGRRPARCAECVKRKAIERGRNRSPESRKTSTPCAGCGKPLWGSRSSLPPGERKCQACRSDRLRRKAAAGEFDPGNIPGRHGRAWRKLRALVIEEETNCFRCGGLVDKSLKYPDPNAPSADHIKDIREGGAPLDRDNVRLAHFGCNSADGARKRFARGSGEDDQFGPTRAKEVMTAAGRVAQDETQVFLTMIRTKLADEMNAASGAESAVIAKELRAVVGALAQLDSSSRQGGSILDQLAAKRAARVANATG